MFILKMPWGPSQHCVSVCHLKLLGTMLHDLSLGLLEVFLFHCFGLTKTSEVKGHFTTLVVTVDSWISSVLLSEYQLNKHQQCTHQTRYCCCLFSPDTSLIRQWIYSAISIIETTKASPLSILIFTLVKKVKVAHTRLLRIGLRSWSWFLAVSLQVTWVINPAVGCHYFPPSLQLPPQPLRGLLPILLLGEQRHSGCEQLA